MKDTTHIHEYVYDPSKSHPDGTILIYQIRNKKGEIIYIDMCHNPVREFFIFLSGKKQYYKLEFWTFDLIKASAEVRRLILLYKPKLNIGFPEDALLLTYLQFKKIDPKIGQHPHSLIKTWVKNLGWKWRGSKSNCLHLVHWYDLVEKIRTGMFTEKVCSPNKKKALTAQE